MLHVISEVLEDADQDIIHSVLAQMTDVGVVVYGRATAVHTNVFVLDGDKLINRPRQCIEKFHDLILLHFEHFRIEE